MDKIDAMIQKHIIYEAYYDSDYDTFEDNCIAVSSVSDSISEVEPVNMHIQFENIETKTFVDSGSVWTGENWSNQYYCEM